MIKKRVILLFIIVFLIMSSSVKAELIINIPENIILNPGELKIIQINIKNISASNQTITPDLKLPDNWKLIIPLKSVTIGPNEKRNMNILIQPPKLVRSANYPLNLLVKTQKEDYKIKIQVKIKEIHQTEVKVVKAPNFIKEDFKIKLKLINKGNTFRHFKIINNKRVAIDKTNIFLNSFESKIITFNCKVKKHEGEELALNIRAADVLKNSISLFNDTLTILEPDRNFKKYDSRLRFSLFKVKKDFKKHWKLKTLLNDRSLLEVGNDHFNYYQRNKKSRWQFGTEYFDRIKLNELSDNDKIIKLSYEHSQSNNFNNIVYTDFINEIGFGVSKYLERNFYYLEFKNNKFKRIDYYINTRIKRENYQFNYKRSKLKENKQIESFLKYEVNKNNTLKVGFNKVNLNKITNKNYVRYSHQNKNKRITFDYTVLESKNKNYIIWGLSKKNIGIIGEYILNSSLKYKRIKNKWKPEFKLILKNNKNKFLIKKNYKNRYELEVQKIFESKNGRFRVSINNYGKAKFNINTKKEYIINNKEVYLTGNFSYTSNNSFKIKNIKLGINLPFTLKLEKKAQNRVCGKIRGVSKKLGGIVLDVNGQKVKTETDGSFISYIDSSKKVSIKAVDLGKYTGKYFLSPKMPYLIKDYSGEEIFLDLIEYGNLKIIFHNNVNESSSYLEIIPHNRDKRSGNIILHNEQHTFFKEFKGEKEISLKNIPPGQYVLKMDNEKVSNNYKFKNRNIKIRPGNNQISIKKLPLSGQGLKIEEEVEKIKINN